MRQSISYEGLLPVDSSFRESRHAYPATKQMHLLCIPIAELLNAVHEQESGHA
jgi:hypothetical protein